MSISTPATDADQHPRHETNARALTDFLLAYQQTR